MDYFEDQKPRKYSALCSDPACPCNETPIPAGGGYLWVSRELVEFRSDCRTEEQRDKKLDRISRQSGYVIMFGPGVAGPILMCEVGARKRGFNLAVAAADARHWWNTGQVPYRVTPMDGQSGEPQLSAGAPRQSESQPGGCGIVFFFIFAGYAAFQFWPGNPIL